MIPNIKTRKCPSCGQCILYQSKYSCQNAERGGRSCHSCAIKAVAARPEEKERRRLALKSLYEKDPLRTSGDRNGFYGKKHTNKTKAIIASRETSYLKTPAFSEAVKKGMNGKSNQKPVYQCWLEKYGKEEADQRMLLMRAKQSIASAGKNNPMYGRPAPQGSGNGWKGWLDGVFFRSLRELSFRISNQTCRSMETAKDAIPYLWGGVERNYYPDFFIDNTIIEIKPKRLWNTPLISTKRKAAEEYGRLRGWRYEMVDPPIVVETIQSLVIEGRVIFTPRYQQKFDEWTNTSIHALCSCRPLQNDYQ